MSPASRAHYSRAPVSADIMDGSDLIKFLFLPALCFIFDLQRGERSVRYWQCLLSIKTDTMTNLSGHDKLINDIWEYGMGNEIWRVVARGVWECFRLRDDSLLRWCQEYLAPEPQTKYATQKLNNQVRRNSRNIFCPNDTARVTDQMSIILQQSRLSVWSEGCI